MTPADIDGLLSGYAAARRVAHDALSVSSEDREEVEALAAVRDLAYIGEAMRALEAVAVR